MLSLGHVISKCNALGFDTVQHPGPDCVVLLGNVIQAAQE